MFIRAYLRASTKEQYAKHAKNELIQFATDHGHKGDVILVDQIDRLASLNQSDWDALERILSVVSKELLTSYMAIQSESSTEFMSSVLQAINNDA